MEKTYSCYYEAKAQAIKDRIKAEENVVKAEKDTKQAENKKIKY